MNIMLYFGSFNPLHNGHLAIAQWVVEQEVCDEIWLVVSPQNPFKKDDELLPEERRLQMAALAVAASAYPHRIRVSEIEFGLPKPSYTIGTMAELERRHPGYSFSILMGRDNVEHFDRWKAHRELMARYPIFLYPRTGSEQQAIYTGMILLEGAPLFPFSSTEIRKAIETGCDISGMVPQAVYDNLKEQPWRYKMK